MKTPWGIYPRRGVGCRWRDSDCWVSVGGDGVESLSFLGDENLCTEGFGGWGVVTFKAVRRGRQMETWETWQP